MDQTKPSNDLGVTMTINERKSKDVLIVAPEGKITMGSGDQELTRTIREALAAGNRKILIDFTKVTVLDSSGLGELVECYTSVKNLQGELRLCGLNFRIHSLLQMTNFLTVFVVKDTEAEALAEF